MSDGKHADDETSLLFPNEGAHGEQQRRSVDSYMDSSDSGESTVRFFPLDVPKPPTAGGFGMSDGNSGLEALTPVEKHRYKGLIISAVVFIALIAALVGGFFAARAYFSDKAAPGVTVGGQSVTGQDESALRTTVNAAYSSSKVHITDANGKTLSASLSDLGVTLDVNTTVSNVLNAKSSEMVGQVNPFNTTSVALTLKTDDSKMTDFLTSKLVDESQQARAASVEYDSASNTFVAKSGADGQTPEISTVKAAVSKLADDPGTSESAAVTYSEVKAPITEQTATQVAQDANARLQQAIVINNGEGKSFTVPAKEVATWMSFSNNLDNGSISIVVNQDAAKTYLQQELPTALNQDAVVEKNIKNSQGTVLAVTTKGVNGVAVKDTDVTAQEVVNNLNAGQSATIKAQSDVTKYTTTSTVAQYDIPNGDMWIQVDRSQQKVTVYKGTTVVKTFNVVTGKNGDRESDPGTFFINIKYETQDMRGADYLSKGVKWISYYNGGEGFHAAPWNLTAIAKGDPVNYGSHGCINMIPAEAQWIYQNAPVGTMVKVIGAQPTAAVR
ncbi:L,D-transpeptidase [Bifidobacterium sp.]|jgi:lipoprotein-anchoring transpeptidase ErfK/SrfK|uniref:L,D-transpeptidase n=1 Tax=Bifidobacterium sp. TaxID=41200 RepID=UPI0025BCDA9B|nr:L,D-transpeptidase [Bifidobacterium sp.]MCI1636292.1 L,D-transpeptidase [Bifidobacterium sp.]